MLNHARNFVTIFFENMFRLGGLYFFTCAKFIKMIFCGASHSGCALFVNITARSVKVEEARARYSSVQILATESPVTWLNGLRGE